eukprot:10298022-Heterocapsa_arctica.AAC.1
MGASCSIGTLVGSGCLVDVGGQAASGTCSRPRGERVTHMIGTLLSSMLSVDENPSLCALSLAAALWRMRHH